MAGSNVRGKIIHAATEVIYNNGYYNASISEIAGLAGISPSLIYKHFKSKEDLLFSIPLENSIQFYKTLENDLQGIEGSENLLRKLTWSLLHFYDLHPKYAIILLMECRSNRSFYRSEAYRFVKRLSEMFLSIFEAGKERGEFNRNANSFLVRDLIFGAMDQSVLSCLVLHEIDKITDDVKGLFQLFCNMTRIPTQSNGKKDDKGSLLLNAAVDVFVRRGYHEATISEIATKANVSDGILYQYFQNKEDLLFSIAKRKAAEDLTELEEVFNTKSPLMKLRRFITHYCHLCLTNRNYLDIFLTLIQTNRKFYQTPAYGLFKQYGELITGIIEEGQKKAAFSSEVNARIFRNMLLGGINHLFLRWLVVGKSATTDKTCEIDEVTNLLASSLSK